MVPPIHKKQDAVDGMKDALYSRTKEPASHIEERSPLSPLSEHVPASWSDIRTPTLEASTPGRFDPFQDTPYVKPNFLEEPMARKKGLSFATKFFVASVVFFLGAVGVAAYLFFFGGNTISSQNIDLQVVAPSLIDSGKESSLQILINNHNQTPLQLVDLIINYPDGTRDPADDTKSLIHDRQTIGSIASGEQVKRIASALFYGQEGTPQKVTVTLEYSTPGSNAVLEKTASADFLVGASPVSVSVQTPTEAISGQQFGFDIVVQSNATTPIDNVMLQGQYPFGFSVISATPQADAGGTVWRLGTLAPGASQTVHVVGQVDGQDGDQRVFRFLVGSDEDHTDTVVKVPLLSVPQTLTVRRPFISASIAVGGQSGKMITAAAGAQQNGTITWKNNLPDTVTDLQVTLTLTGPALDPTSINTSDGFYQSSNRTITWTKDQEPTLASVPPGGTGTLGFTFSTLPPGAGGAVYANPTVDLTVGLAGVRPGQDSVPQNVTSAATAEVSLSSLLGLTAQTVHFSGPFSNTGPMPPVAEQSTTYSVVWSVTNSSNTIANALVSATLPPYVRFLGAQSGSGITYDAPSRTVTWTLGELTAGAGYSGASRTGAFQIAFTPSASQVGGSPTLTGQALLSGQDRFANVKVQTTADAPTTMLVGDSGFSSSMGQVVGK